MTAHTITTKLPLLLSLLALGALGLVACGGDDDETRGTTEATLSPEQKIEQAGNEWGALFAAGRVRAAGEYQTQPLTERITCKRISGPIRNCTPPSSEFPKSFEDVTVRDIAIKGDHAAAKFSNDEAVELAHVSGRGWLIHKIGGNAGDVEFIAKVGNEWAPLFARDVSAACRYMYGQPLCEEFFRRVGEPPEVGPPSAFQRSFANATVERVEVKGDRAGAEFSNGELVEFIQDPQGPPSSLGDWFINDVGGNAGRRLFE